MRMLILKELRTALPIVVLAMLAYGWMVMADLGLYGADNYGTDDLTNTAMMSLAWASPNTFMLITMCLGATLGLISGMADNGRRTWQFVLFRPISRRTYVGIKLAVGVLVTLATSAVPVVILMWIEASPGFRAAPFVWQAFLPLWECCGLGACIFCGAFLSSVRTASWWWSKLWPLLGVGVVSWTLHLSQFLTTLTSSSLAYWIACGVIVWGTAALSVQAIEERDFT